MATTETASRATTVMPEPAPVRRTHPPSRYWDHRTASWQTASLVPVPRRAG